MTSSTPSAPRKSGSWSWSPTWPARGTSCPPSRPTGRSSGPHGWGEGALDQPADFGGVEGRRQADGHGLRGSAPVQPDPRGDPSHQRPGEPNPAAVRRGAGALAAASVRPARLAPLLLGGAGQRAAGQASRPAQTGRRAPDGRWLLPDVWARGLLRLPSAAVAILLDGGELAAGNAPCLRGDRRPAAIGRGRRDERLPPLVPRFLQGRE